MSMSVMQATKNERASWAVTANLLDKGCRRAEVRSRATLVKRVRGEGIGEDEDVEQKISLFWAVAVAVAQK